MSVLHKRVYGVARVFLSISRWITRFPPASAQIHHHLNHHGRVSWTSVVPSISLNAMRTNAVFHAIFKKISLRMPASKGGSLLSFPPSRRHTRANEIILRVLSVTDVG